ncbi:MAG: hypothetical protein AB1453_08225 [Chloroflexota bacterium]
MRNHFVIEEIMEAGSGEGLLRLSEADQPVIQPGQFCLAWRKTGDEILPVVLFPSLDRAGGQCLCGDLPDSWRPGDSVYLKGALGRGFDLPKNTRRAGFLAVGVSFSRLVPVVLAAVGQGCEVVCCGDTGGYRLPAEVEILPVSQSGVLLDWADYLALDGSHTSLAELAVGIWKNTQIRSTLKTEALLRTTMACGGVADCGVCALPIKRGWALACKDGPVFDFARLEFSVSR